MRRILLITLLVAFASSALAWNDTGHKIVASIAFRQLTPKQQAKIVAILKNHPRWKEDFEAKMPEELKTEAEQNEWIFQQAAIWPDMARGFKDDDKREYHHSTWHYINIPQFLSPADEQMYGDKLKFNQSLEMPLRQQEEMNAIQTIKFTRAVIPHEQMTDAQRAVALCWLFHLVGDIHQPLHSTALVCSVFPNGDKGGNEIKTKQRSNLHSVWDQFLGTKSEFREARNKAIVLVNDPDTAKQGRQSAKLLDEVLWLNESHQLCAAYVYGPEVVGYIRALAESNSKPEEMPLTLSEDYLKQGGAVAEKRVIAGGYRLGGVLSQLYSR